MSVVGQAIQQRRVVTLRAHSLRVAAIGCALCALLLFTVNLTTWPVPWYDEGVYISAAAMLAQTGTYGLAYGDHQLVIMDPEVTIGPTIVGPIALVFKVFGVGILQARLTMVVFTILALLSFYLLARLLGGVIAALSGTIFLLAGNGEPYTSFVPLGRHVMGEVPALGFFCLGCWFWLRGATEGRPTFQAGVAGGCFGMAMITKPQMIPLALTVLAIVGVGNFVYYRACHWRAMLVAGGFAAGCVSFWYGLQLSTSGPHEATFTGTFLADHIADFSLKGPRTALGTLWRTAFILWGVPGLAYGLYLARQRTAHGLMHAAIVVAIMASLCWYALLSVGWSRYASLPLMLTTVYSGRLYADLLTGRLHLERDTIARWATTGITFAFPLIFLFFAIMLVKPIVGPQDTSAQDMAAYMRREIPAEVRVETWAWELVPLTPQRYHHPDGRVLALYISAIWRGQSVPAQSYDPGASSPEYLLEGPFSGWTGIYSTFIEIRGDKIAQFGDYALYKTR